MHITQRRKRSYVSSQLTDKQSNLLIVGPLPGSGGLILGIPLLDPGVAASLLGGVSDFGTGDVDALLLVSFCGC